MKVMAINGSPRTTWNTATMLAKALEGAASQGAETELIHLYDLNFKGCVSCFSCKTIDGPSYGRCAVEDDLAPILQKAAEADAFILGSPFYFGTVSGEMRSFMERLMFPYLAYAGPPRSLFPRKIKTGFIYTMNAPEEGMKPSDKRNALLGMNGCWGCYSGLQSRFVASKPGSLRIIQRWFRTFSMLRREQKDARRFFPKTAKRLSKWGPGLP